jgi:hypothetical protein
MARSATSALNCASIPALAGTSLARRARCFSGSQSSIEGGGRNAVSRSKLRKLLMGAGPERWRIDATILPLPPLGAKSDRLLAQRLSMG